jgi:hypothetical protein
MSQPGQIEALAEWLKDHPGPLDPEPGRFYPVPCARHRHKEALPPRGKSWWPKDGWLPLIGPVHEDREVVGFEPLHVHVDTRFLSSLPSGLFTEMYALASPLCLTGHMIFEGRYVLEFSMKRRLCRRQPLRWDPTGISWAQKMKDAHRGCQVGADGLCPHRGIPLAASHRLPDGSVVCVGHGLRWAADGSLIDREVGP